MTWKKKSFHFVGIGGIGMCGLAELLHNSGGFVQGSDLQENSQVQYLKKIGIPVFIGHDPSHIKENIDILVYSSAVREDNVELQEARKRGLTVIRRAEALAEMMRLKRGIVVAGTHGKTTTTSFLASLFTAAKKDPTVVAGGRLDLFKSTAHLGRSEWFIAESDESDGSFHHLFPEFIVLTNIDDDHVDFYGSFEELKKSFSRFLGKIPFYGSIIACGDCSHSREVISSHSFKKIFYGFNEDNDFILKKENEKYSVFYKNEKWIEFSPPIIGDHNALNALGSMVCCWQIGMDKKYFADGLHSFKGVQRRMERKGEYKNILFLDDYAHHPTEVKAVLSALKEKFKDRRVVALFQPHRYSRFKNCWDGFLNCFPLADKVCVSEVYPAGEIPLKGIDSETFIKKMKHKDCEFVSEKNFKSFFTKNLRSGDVFITLGAGSISRLGTSLLEEFKA